MTNSILYTNTQIKQARKEGLDFYAISYYENNSDFDASGLLIWECLAEDEEHAKEQLLDSEPNAFISLVHN